MNTVYLLLGSNMGDSEQMLTVATNMIEKNIGKLTTSSAIYRTAAWGKEDQPDFLNQIIIVSSSLSSSTLLKKSSLELLSICSDKLNVQKN